MTGTVRSYGNGPFGIAVLHGGPGAAGSAAPVARELGKDTGVLEPIQTALTVDGQIEELREQLLANAELPIVLIGHSWGAMLAYMFTGHHPEMVRKLIMIGSGVLEEEYTQQIKDIRMSRVAPENRAEAEEIMARLNTLTDENQRGILARLGEITEKCDHFDPLPHEPDPEPLEFMPKVHVSVWSDAKVLRKSGEMLLMGEGITCPVLVIHGDYDPHPLAGVMEPLARIGIVPKTIILEQCGHEPWSEKNARETFFEVARQEIASL